VRSKLITFEGIDGAGKTIVARGVCQALEASGEDVGLTSEPTATWVGEAVRRSLQEETDPLTRALLFLADRSHHFGEMQAWLSKGRVVLCDRYVDSTLAYQGTALEGVLPSPTDWLRGVGAPFTIPPHLTILLLIEPREALARISGRGQRTVFEDEGFLQRVQRQYLALAREDRFVKVDAARPLGIVVEEVLGVIRTRLRRGKP
jgi:dTMP kinase